MIPLTKSIAILGATGSVGVSTLSVVEAQPGYEVFGLSANVNVDKMLELCLRLQPKIAVMVSIEHAEQLRAKLLSQHSDTEVLAGEEGLCALASHSAVDTVMCAIVGAAGLESTLAAARSGKKLLLANKEALVMAGELLLDIASQNGALLLPIDSEHNAIFQCLPIEINSQANYDARQVRRVILTASGGPFLEASQEQLSGVTPEQACAHPTWDMGRKISVDSATLMNKGLEYIEACLLFGLKPEKLEVVIHPQSIVHSLVEYVDGSMLAELASPDMRVPIAHALAWPQRIASGAQSLDLVAAGSLNFLQPDLERFPCLALGIAAANRQGTAPAILNAANEVAVAAFLGKKIPFTSIPIVITEVLEKIPCEAATSTDIILTADTLARDEANRLINK